jgi:hypothetical protein
MTGSTSSCLFPTRRPQVWLIKPILTLLACGNITYRSGLEHEDTTAAVDGAFRTLSSDSIKFQVCFHVWMAALLLQSHMDDIDWMLETIAKVENFAAQYSGAIAICDILSASSLHSCAQFLRDVF